MYAHIHVYLRFCLSRSPKQSSLIVASEFYNFRKPTSIVSPSNEENSRLLIMSHLNNLLTIYLFISQVFTTFGYWINIGHKTGKILKHPRGVFAIFIINVFWASLIALLGFYSFQTYSSERVINQDTMRRHCYAPVFAMRQKLITLRCSKDLPKFLFILLHSYL